MEQAKAETQQIPAMARIKRAFSSMPYGAAADFVWGMRATDDLTLEDIATNLERLRDFLTSVSERDQAQEQELREINRDLGAWGRLMNRAKAQA